MATKADRPARRGRPRKVDEAQLQDAFLDYCLGQFIALGYRNATVDALARGFGAGKSTIYARYGSKAGLVRVAMERGVPLLLDPLAKVDADPGRNPRDVLREFGAVIQSYACEPNIRAMWRAVSDAREDMENIETEVVALRDRILAPIVRYLAGLKESGSARTANPHASAVLFGELVAGGLGQFLGVPPAPEEREEALDLAVDLFCHGMLVDIA